MSHSFIWSSLKCSLLELDQLEDSSLITFVSLYYFVCSRSWWDTCLVWAAMRLLASPAKWRLRSSAALCCTTQTHYHPVRPMCWMSAVRLIKSVQSLTASERLRTENAQPRSEVSEENGRTTAVKDWELSHFSVVLSTNELTKLHNEQVPFTEVAMFLLQLWPEKPLPLLPRFLLNGEDGVARYGLRTSVVLRDGRWHSATSPLDLSCFIRCAFKANS